MVPNMASTCSPSYGGVNDEIKDVDGVPTGFLSSLEFGLKTSKPRIGGLELTLELVSLHVLC